MTREERIDEIVGTWRQARDRGEALQAAEVVAQNPDLAAELWERFTALDVLDRLLRESRLKAGALQGLGDYRVVREIGRGGMGVVYEAEQGSMRRRVALKVLYPKITGSADAVKRFQREARAAGRLHHTNIVPVHDLGREEDLWFYSMELVDGLSLSQILKGMRRLGGGPKGPVVEEKAVVEPVPAAGAEVEEQSPGTGSFGTDSGTLAWYRRVARAFAGVAEGLEAAHEEGVIHRDVKPSNLILDADGTLKIIDFGLARIVGSHSAVTASGDRLGTPLYMSPEQARNEKADHRTDVYSLGATLYELLTLHPAHAADDDRQVIASILSRDPPPPRRRDPHIPRDLETIVVKAMEKEPRRRYATAAEMAADLRAFAQDDAIGARRVGPLGRSWRRVRRHKVVSSLVAAILVLTVAGIALAGKAAREEDQRRALEYRLLLTRAEQALAWCGEGRSVLYRELGMTDALQVFDRAIAVDDRRPEAFLGRALTVGRPPQASLADIESARIRGVSPRITHLARAHVLWNAGRRAEAAKEQRLAEELPPEGAVDAFFEGRLLVAAGDLEKGLARLGEALAGAEEGSVYRYLALLIPTEARRQAGDLGGVLEDLSALRAAGDDTIGVRVQIAGLWRRLDNEKRGEALFGELLEEVRARGDLDHWALLAGSCRPDDAAWKERAAREGLEVHPDAVPLMTELLRALIATERHEEQIEVCARIVDLDPKHILALQAWGDALRALGRCEEALERFDALLAVDPSNIAARNNRGCALVQLGRREEALAAFEAAIEIDPRALDPHLNRAGTLNELQRFDEGLQAADRALELDPQASSAFASRGKALFHLGRLEAALEVLDEAIRLGARDHAHEWRGTVLGELGRWAEALEDHEAELQRNPNNFSALSSKASALRALGRTEEALEVILRARKLDPGFPWAHVEHGHILLNLGDPARALAEFDHGEELWRAYYFPPRPSQRHHIDCLRGSALRRLERFAEALECYERSVPTKPDCLATHYGRSVCLLNLRRLDECVAATDDALRIDPKHIPTWQVRAEALARLGRGPEASAAYDRSMDDGPNDAELRQEQGDLLRRAGFYDEAIAAFKASITLEPDWPLAEDRALTRQGELCLALISAGKITEAEQRLARLIEDLPDVTGLRMMRARCLAWLGRSDEAAGQAAQALEMGLNTKAAMAWSAEIALLQGRAAHALRAARRLAAKDPLHYGWLHVSCLRALGEDARAREVAEECIQDDPPQGTRIEQAYLQAVLGKREQALNLLERVERPWYGQEALLRARVHAVLGDDEEARRWVVVAVGKGFVLPGSATVHPDLAGVIPVGGASATSGQ